MNAATSTETSTSHDTSDQHAGGHGHASERPSYDDINVPVVLLVGVISAILTFITIWFVEGIYYHWNRGLVRQRILEVTNSRQDEMLQQQRAVLDGDEERGITSVDSAIPAVVARFGATANDSGEDHDDHAEQDDH